MHVALLADIHGNAVALDAVLSAVDEERPDEVVCLGDVAATGPAPIDCLERIEALGCPVVAGNTDEWLLDPSLDEGEDESLQLLREIDAWCADRLGPSHERVLESFASTVTLDLDDGTRMCGYHGSPRSHSDRIVATTPEPDLATWFAGIDATVMAGAHTHEQLFRRYEERLVVNPGSVGLPHEYTRDGAVRHPPWAEWAMVSVEDGSTAVELRRTPVDADAVVERAETSDMPHADAWTDGWRK